MPSTPSADATNPIPTSYLASFFLPSLFIIAALLAGHLAPPPTLPGGRAPKLSPTVPPPLPTATASAHSFAEESSTRPLASLSPCLSHFTARASPNAVSRRASSFSMTTSARSSAEESSTRPSASLSPHLSRLPPCPCSAPSPPPPTPALPFPPLVRASPTLPRGRAPTLSPAVPPLLPTATASMHSFAEESPMRPLASLSPWLSHLTARAGPNAVSRHASSSSTTTSARSSAEESSTRPSASLSLHLSHHPTGAGPNAVFHHTSSSRSDRLHALVHRVELNEALRLIETALGISAGTCAALIKKLSASGLQRNGHRVLGARQLDTTRRLIAEMPVE